MIVGEARSSASQNSDVPRPGSGSSDSILELCVNKAIHVGIECRKRTRINRGAVSVGSAAVLFAEEQIGSLRGRHILVIEAVKMEGGLNRQSQRKT